MMTSRILIVEDQMVVAMDIDERLISMGYEVTGQAKTSERALELAGQERPDLVLMDIRLQGDVDGIMAAQQIRERFRIPVIFLTAHSDESTLEMAKTAEPFGYVLKPFNDRELRSAIEIALYKHGAEREIHVLNRLYDVLSQVNQAVVRTGSSEELFAAVCRLLVERGGIDLAWIGRLDKQTSLIRPVASFGEQSEFPGKAEHSVNNSTEGQGSPGKTVREERPFICNECGSAGCFYPGKQSFSWVGFESCGSFPIMFQGAMWGSLNVCVRQPEFFHARQTKLLEEVASDISFFLDKIEGDARRKDAEESLRASEARYRTLIESAPEAIYVQSGGRFVYVNPEMVRLMGASGPEDLLGREFMPFVTPECCESVRECMSFQKATGRPSPPMEQEYFRADGSLIPVETTAILIRHEGRDETLVFVRDITERKRTESELRRTTEMLHLVVQSSPLAINMFDRDGRVIIWNTAAERLFGWKAEEVLGRSVPTWMPAVDGETSGFLPRVLKGKQVTRMETRRLRKDGSIVDIEITAAPVHDAENRIIGALGIIMDISDRKKAEKERESLMTQLSHSQKMEGIGRLAGGIAHDFNNILSVILGYSYLLARQMNGHEDFIGNLVEIQKAGERATALTNQLLAFSRKQVLKPVSLDLSIVIVDMDNMLQRIVGEDIEIKRELSSGLGLVYADRSQIEQVIMNLVINARDAMPRGGTINLLAANVAVEEAQAKRERVKTGPFVMLAVHDTGTGMDNETMLHIFEPFFTTKEMGKGTGLGLATVYGIVKQSDGFISVDSEVGRGTTFRIFLPMMAQEQATEDETSDEVLEGVAETILVVEDNKALSDLIDMMLSDAGYKVIVASNGEEGIKVFREHESEVDLVLTDVVMPLMSGSAMVEEIMKIRPEIRVLYMSGYTDDKIVHHGMLEKGIHFISKPIIAKTFLRKVRSVLDGEEP